MIYLNQIHNYLSNHLVVKKNDSRVGSKDIFWYVILATTCNLSEFSNINKLKVGNHHYINFEECLHDQLASTRPIPAQSKNLTKFTLDKFKDLYLDVYSTIVTHTCTT